MRCVCGYDFTDDVLRSVRERGAKGHDSYLLVHDRDFKKFIRHEVKWAASAAAKDKDGALRSIAKAAKYAGGVHVCPECARLHLWAPGMEKQAVYRPEQIRLTD